ncbi:MAG: rhodanese-like domain-containing protein [Acidobacteria bacterium]|nr:MAG: rhodanese-like domain-containing protein [Acidobacteriota bacterium]
MKRMGLAVSATLAMGALMACIVLALETQSAAGRPAQVPSAGKAAELATAVQIEPEVLAKLLQGSKTGTKPVVLHVGFKNFYDQARIPGSYYAGPGFRPEGLELLRQRVASLQPEQLIVLYCGCCPWDKCPNVKPAYDALHAMGFTNVKVVHIAENFGANWMNAGLPTTKAH